VGTGELQPNAVTATKIAPGAIFDASGHVDYDPAVAANTCDAVTLDAAGVLAGDQVILALPADWPLTLLTQTVVQDENDKLQFRVCNVSGAAVPGGTPVSIGVGVIR
jgi:hypothetical protein